MTKHAEKKELPRSHDDFFDARAKGWEDKCYPPPVRERLESLIPKFDARPKERVLDIGTGPGVLLPYLRKAVGKEGFICAFDLSFPMACQARKKPLSERDLVFQADVHRMPFAGGRFDRAICFAAFPHFSEPSRAVAEMARVLRPGGTLVIAHLMSRSELAAHHGNHEVVKEDLLPDAARMTDLFLGAGLSAPEITNRPGRYLAVGKRLGTERTQADSG